MLSKIIFISCYTVSDSFSFKTVAANGGSDTSHPKALTPFTISSSGLYLSSISSKDQAAGCESKNISQRQRWRWANVYSRQSHDEEEKYIQKICGHNKRKRSGKEISSTIQYPVRDVNNLHASSLCARGCFSYHSW